MKLAYITSQFPETYETFILREFVEAKRQGLDFTIYSLKPCRDRVVHAEAASLLKRTRSAGRFGLVMAARNLKAAFLHPLAWFGLFFRIIFKHLFRPKMLIRSLGGLALGANIAGELVRDGITHVHAHWITVPATAALAVSRLTGIPFSVTAHAWDIFTGDNLLREKVRSARFIATCTAFNKKHLEKILGGDAEGKIFLNYHGIEIQPVRERRPRGDRPMRIFSVGRLVEQKGFPYLIEALQSLKHRLDFNCTIIGEGPMRQDLEKMVHDSGLGGTITLPGVVELDVVWEQYYANDVFVLPCVVTDSGDRDGIPNVLVEAMAARCPVITTDVSGIPELVENRVSGLTVPERNAPAIAEAVMRIAENPPLGLQVAEMGRKFVERMFNLERNVSEFLEILKKHAEN